MLAEPRCNARNCKHLQGVKELGEQEDTQVVFCPAYPDGIPDRIAYGSELHLIVQSDQVGEIVFEKDTE